MSSKKKEPQKLNYSENIAQFTHMVKQVQSDFVYHTERMKKNGCFDTRFSPSARIEEFVI